MPPAIPKFTKIDKIQNSPTKTFLCLVKDAPKMELKQQILGFSGF
jgi:hypothetical protein